MLDQFLLRVFFKACVGVEYGIDVGQAIEALECGQAFDEMSDLGYASIFYNTLFWSWFLIAQIGCNRLLYAANLHGYFISSIFVSLLCLDLWPGQFDSRRFPNATYFEQLRLYLQLYLWPRLEQGLLQRHCVWFCPKPLRL